MEMKKRDVVEESPVHTALNKDRGQVNEEGLAYG